MAYAPVKAHDERRIAGYFRHAETKKEFEYSKPLPDDKVVFTGFDRQVWVGPLQETRWAKVLETVAYIVVDEDENGWPVTERWPLSKHRHYRYPNERLSQLEV